MGLFKDLFSNDIKKRNQSYGMLHFLEEQEKENKEDKDLEDWQKKLIKENKYESYNFEEEDLEDDDYYEDEED